MKKETDHHILYEASKCVLSLGKYESYIDNKFQCTTLELPHHSAVLRFVYSIGAQ